MCVACGCEVSISIRVRVRDRDRVRVRVRVTVVRRVRLRGVHQQELALLPGAPLATHLDPTASWHLWG